MDWLHQPAYTHVRDKLIKRFKNPYYRFRTIRHVIFLCGAANSTVRDRLADYLRRFHPDKLLFYAEDVWKHIASAGDLNALRMEDELAQLADLVIIVVESPGTFAELGAFSLSTELRKKLLPIVDTRYKIAESFINAGPIKWVDADSAFRPAIYADYSVILNASEDLEDRLQRLPKRGVEFVSRIASSPKHLLFLLCDLLAIIGPVPEQHCDYYLERILDIPPKWGAGKLIALGVSMRIIKYVQTNSGARFYYRPLEGDMLEPFQHKRMFHLSKERANFLGVMQRIPQAQAVLGLLRVT